MSLVLEFLVDLFVNAVFTSRHPLARAITWLIIALIFAAVLAALLSKLAG